MADSDETIIASGGGGRGTAAAAVARLAGGGGRGTAAAAKLWATIQELVAKVVHADDKFTAILVDVAVQDTHINARHNVVMKTHGDTSFLARGNDQRRCMDQGTKSGDATCQRHTLYGQNKLFGLTIRKHI